jgi:aldose 1-epimerase
MPPDHGQRKGIRLGATWISEIPLYRRTMTRIEATTTAVDRDVTEIVMDNGRIAVTIWSYGATLVSVEVPDRFGRRRNVVVRRPDLTAYKDPRDRVYMGSTLGRFARIVSNGRLSLDGRDHYLARNAGEDHIHGGPEGFDARNWQTWVEKGPGNVRAVLLLRSPDGDQGYPGTLTTRVTYELNARHCLTVRYEAITDAPTLYGLSPHIFWNPGEAPTIDDLELQLSTRYVLDANEDFVPTGRVLPVRHTPLDFTEPRRLGAVKIDDCFVASAVPPPAGTASAVAEVATIRDRESGRRIVVRTDQTATAAYTGDLLPGRPRAGLCLQPGPWPDAPNQPSFPSAILRPGRVHRSRTTFSLLTDERVDQGADPGD